MLAISAPLALVAATFASSGDQPPANPAVVSAPQAAASESQAGSTEDADAAPQDIQPIDEASLDSERGGQSVVVGNQSLTAVTTGNVLNGDYTAGSVSFSDNSFSNFNGLGNVSINTGAQVSLQSAMNVVINIAP
ncbi:MAG: hypothetical protein ABW203_08165 [Novosphingobium sp.]